MIRAHAVETHDRRVTDRLKNIVVNHLFVLLFSTCNQGSEASTKIFFHQHLTSTAQAIEYNAIFRRYNHVLYMTLKAVLRHLIFITESDLPCLGNLSGHD